MSCRRVWFFVIAAVAVASAGNVRASVVRAMSLSELTRAADSIVVGTVASIKAEWDPQHRTIISIIEVDVEESWKGAQAVNRRIAVMQLGGSVGDIEMTVLGMPSFSAGEKSVLFLQGQRRFQVVGMGQGKRALAWNGQSSQWLAHAPATVGVVEAGRDAKLRQARRPSPMSLDDLRAQVLREIRNSP